MKCEYGCENDAPFVLKNGKKCCQNHSNKCPAIRKKNSEGLKSSYSKGDRTPIWTNEHRDKSNEVRRSKFAEIAFVENSNYTNASLKSLLFNHYKWENKCSDCGLSEWRGQPLTMELDHINGNSSDNRIENLRILCPNCHSQTPTFRGRNINKGDIKVEDEILIQALKEQPNIRQALISVGLAAKGANYSRAKKLLTETQETV